VHLGAAGLGIGALAALGLGRVLQHVLRGVTASDPLSFVAAPGILLAVTLAASAVPAWRASRVDPAIALRDE
jgi:putative ABC transport system permease protein